MLVEGKPSFRKEVRLLLGSHRLAGKRDQLIVNVKPLGHRGPGKLLTGSCIEHSTGDGRRDVILIGDTVMPGKDLV